MFEPAKITIQHTSPHIRRKRTASMCMWHVVTALIPTTICALYFFGLPALEVIVAAVAVSVGAEWLIARYMMGDAGKASLPAAALTGLLLALNLPSIAPLWTVAAGAVFAIGICKMAFGGLGCNIFNPAIGGRVFMLISFPVAMTTWPVPGVAFQADGHTGATLLSALKEGAIPDSAYTFVDMLSGNMGGSMGEVSSAALLLGLAYLLALRVITWHIPTAIIGTVVVLDLCLGIQAGIDILSGGLLLGAIFMATDYVTSPMTGKGMLLYGALIGVITVVIRRWGAYPEGVSFAILIMNGFTPLINKYMKPRIYGHGLRKEQTA
ncbi:MAG: RnfABCDGE type electron transport complex subunit D [Muribaculaceae bacterium]|nr:RnfABCDGE type electron transport complex subunit D [Muribaculaceae bacterium]